MKLRLLHIGLAGMLLLSMLGCEEDVTAVLGSDRAFSLYGVLNPQADTQWVLVYPIAERLDTAQVAKLDVRVTSTDGVSGATYVWRDSLIGGPYGWPDHFFWAPFRADYGHPYQLAVEGVAGKRSTVAVTVPARAQLERAAPSASPTQVTQSIFVRGAVEHLMRIEVTYGVKFDDAVENAEADIVLSYEGRQRRVEGGWQITLTLDRDYRILRDRIQATNRWRPSYGLALRFIRLRLIVANEAWQPPDGVFDPDVLVQPGTMSNVENGFGFVGAGYRLSEIWRPQEEVLAQAGFSPLVRP